ncbi:MAG: sugar-binding transcriptional regulator [Spirochaetales bacterium]|nr:sugar-binding transcriptional regulator [Spirochaetales bacterium]
MKEYRKLSRTDHIRVANYYYNHGLTQEQIAITMDLSRQRINRVLSKCLKDGIVKINVEGMDETNINLENSIEKKYNLKTVRVSNTSLNDDIYTAIGRLAAEYLATIIKNGDIIGFSRGRSISALVDCMPSIQFDDLTITQLMGGRNNQHSNVNVDDIVHRFAKQTNAKSALLFAPVIVNSPAVKKAIMKEPFFLETYNIIKSCTIAVVGIGDASYEPDISSISDEQIVYKKQKFPVGEICTHYYCENGEPVKTSLDEKIIAVGRDDFLKIPTRIGVAGSILKLPAIIGAIKGGYINTLITDQKTAEALA